MAEKVIGLRLQINGVTQTITSIKELETEIGKARDRLSNIAIGSQEFKNLTNEIRNAETEIGKLRQQTEGLTLEKQLEGFGKFTGGITAGFAAASAAAQLFGNDTEEISQAAATAQNLLTVALGARAAAETLAGAKIVATTIATKAQTIATNLSTISLRTLYATMIANPIGAVIASIGLLVTALVAFSEETEDVTKAQRELGKVTSEEAVKLQALDKVLTDINSTNEERLGAINELNKLYPGFNAFIDKENKLTEDGVKFIEAKTKALVTQAQINKILEKIAENNNKQLEVQNRSLEESIGFWDRTKAAILALNNPYTQFTLLVQSAAENNAEATNKIADENNKLQTTLQDLLGQQQKNSVVVDEYNKKLEEQAKKEKEAADANELAERRLAITFANQKRRNELLTNDLQRKLADLKLSYEQERRLAIKNGEDLLLVDKVYTKRRNEILKENQKERESLYKVGLEAIVNLTDEFEKILGEVTAGEEEALNVRISLFNQEFDEFKNKELEKIKFTLEFANFEKAEVASSLARYSSYYEQLRQLQLVNSENQRKVQRANTAIDKQSTMESLKLEEMYYLGITQLQEKYVNDDNTLKQKIRNQELLFQLELLKIQKKAVQDKLEVLKNDPTLNAEAYQRLKTELLKIEVDTANKTKEITANTANDTKAKQEDLVSNLQRGIQEFSNVLNQIASLTQQSFSFQLQRLEADYQNSLDQVVGDTAEANEKRTELELMYQTKRRQIEKQAQISSLQFTLAQTIAAGAQAFVNALASLPPPGNAILAGVQAGLTLAQIAIIKEQLSFVQSQSFARGGFVRGKSHEQGGVRYQAGGIELEGNEAIINRRSTLSYGPLLSQINQQGGGRPLLVNNIMDSRMAEVLASVKSEPIRAYVLEQDITRSQTINKRLEELASY